MTTRTHKRCIYSLAVLCLAYGGWSVYASLYKNRLPESILIYRPDQITVQSEMPNQSELPPLQEFSSSWKRVWQAPLYQEAPPPPPPKRIPPMTLKLTGIIDDGETKTAILQDRQQQSHFVKVGESLQSATVTEIQQNEVSIRFHERIMKLVMKP